MQHYILVVVGVAVTVWSGAGASDTFCQTDSNNPKLVHVYWHGKYTSDFICEGAACPCPESELRP